MFDDTFISYNYMHMLHLNSPLLVGHVLQQNWLDDEEEGAEAETLPTVPECKGTRRRPCSFNKKLLVTLAIGKPQKKKSVHRAQLLPVPAKGTRGGGLNQNRTATFLNSLAGSASAGVPPPRPTRWRETMAHFFSTMAVVAPSPLQVLHGTNGTSGANLNTASCLGSL